MEVLKLPDLSYGNKLQQIFLGDYFVAAKHVFIIGDKRYQTG